MSDRETRVLALQLAVQAHGDDLAAIAHREDHEPDGDVVSKAEQYAEFLSSDE